MIHENGFGCNVFVSFRQKVHYNIAKLSEILNKGTQNGVGTNSFK